MAGAGRFSNRVRRVWGFTKGVVGVEERDLRKCALMSFPRVGFTETFGLVTQSLNTLGFDLRYNNCAYYHQSLQTMMEEALEDGYEWLLTIDYDSVFTVYQLSELMVTFGENPDFDALAALQLRRNSDKLLLTIRGDEDGEAVYLVDGPPIKCTTAHFGLTLFRAEAFQGLPKPWFQATPNPEGSWRDERRTDADIWFWNHWAEHGRNLHVDPRVRLGHLQQVVSDIGPDGKPRHSWVHIWRNRELPR